MSAPLEQNQSEFILAGKAVFTLLSVNTGTRFTYKVKLADKQNENEPDLFFVSLLNGPDNYENYVYIGIIRNGEFRTTAKSKVSDDAPSLKAFAWTWKRIDDIPDTIQIWHEGKCGRCARKLTVPESIQSGFGPECITKLG